MESILNSIKHQLGIAEDYDAFDVEVIQCINSVLATLNQVGLGPKEGFFISNVNTTWTELLGDRKDLEFVKLYIYLKVRLMFDPPQNSTLLSSFDNQAKELEWRINVAVDHESEKD